MNDGQPTALVYHHDDVVDQVYLQCPQDVSTAFISWPFSVSDFCRLSSASLQIRAFDLEKVRVTKIKPATALRAEVHSCITTSWKHGPGQQWLYSGVLPAVVSLPIAIANITFFLLSKVWASCRSRPLILASSKVHKGVRQRLAHRFRHLRR